MSAAVILAQLRAAGVRISRRGDNLLAEPRAAVTEPLLVLIRTHKGELLAALPDEPTTPATSEQAERVELRALVIAVAAFHRFTPAQTHEAHRRAQANHVAALECFRALAQGITTPTDAEARQERLRALLECDPEARWAVLTNDDGGKGPVIVSIAIRGAAMAEFEIERSRYDGALLLELIERACATIH